MPQVCILSNVCHLFPPMLEFLFSFPTQLALFSSSFSLPLSQVSQDTSVSDTSVSPGQVSLHTNICRCDIKISQETYLYTSILPSFTLVYSQTHSLEARLWVSEVTANSPLSKKRALQCLLLFESFQNSTLKYTWQLT